MQHWAVFLQDYLLLCKISIVRTLILRWAIPLDIPHASWSPQRRVPPLYNFSGHMYSVLRQSFNNVIATFWFICCFLFGQSRDAILNGTHPVTQDEAVQFGGIQCQIQFGDHVETKHKPGFLEWVFLHNFLTNFISINNFRVQLSWK